MRAKKKTTGMLDWLQSRPKEHQPILNTSAPIPCNFAPRKPKNENAPTRCILPNSKLTLAIPTIPAVPNYPLDTIPALSNAKLTALPALPLLPTTTAVNNKNATFRDLVFASSKNCHPDEIEKILAFLNSNEHPVLLLVGPHGAGKSWCVKEALRQSGLVEFPIVDDYVKTTTNNPKKSGTRKRYDRAAINLAMHSRVAEWRPGAKQGCAVLDSIEETSDKFITNFIDILNNLLHGYSAKAKPVNVDMNKLIIVACSEYGKECSKLVQRFGIAEKRSKRGNNLFTMVKCNPVQNPRSLFEPIQKRLPAGFDLIRFLARSESRDLNFLLTQLEWIQIGSAASAQPFADAVSHFSYFVILKSILQNKTQSKPAKLPSRALPKDAEHPSLETRVAHNDRMRLEHPVNSRDRLWLLAGDSAFRHVHHNYLHHCDDPEALADAYSDYDLFSTIDGSGNVFHVRDDHDVLFQDALLRLEMQVHLTENTNDTIDFKTPWEQQTFGLEFSNFEELEFLGSQARERQQLQLLHGPTIEKFVWDHALLLRVMCRGTTIVPERDMYEKKSKHNPENPQINKFIEILQHDYFPRAENPKPRKRALPEGKNLDVGKRAKPSP